MSARLVIAFALSGFGHRRARTRCAHTLPHTGRHTFTCHQRTRRLPESASFRVNQNMPSLTARRSIRTDTQQASEACCSVAMVLRTGSKVKPFFGVNRAKHPTEAGKGPSFFLPTRGGVCPGRLPRRRPAPFGSLRGWGSPPGTTGARPASSPRPGRIGAHGGPVSLGAPPRRPPARAPERNLTGAAWLCYDLGTR